MGLSQRQRRRWEGGASSAILGKPEYSLDPSTARYTSCQYATFQSFTAQQSSRADHKPQEEKRIMLSNSSTTCQQLEAMGSPSGCETMCNDWPVEMDPLSTVILGKLWLLPREISELDPRPRQDNHAMEEDVDRLSDCSNLKQWWTNGKETKQGWKCAKNVTATSIKANARMNE